MHRRHIQRPLFRTLCWAVLGLLLQAQSVVAQHVHLDASPEVLCSICFHADHQIGAVAAPVQLALGPGYLQVAAPVVCGQRCSAAVAGYCSRAPPAVPQL